MKIPVNLQLAVLTVGLTGFYMMVGQSVPQKEVQAPEIIVLAEDISTEDMVKIGLDIYQGKGLCSTCHTQGKSGALRFPDLDNIWARAAERKPGYSALDYIAESLYEPGAYIVDGFNPGMPETNRPPIGLSDGEIMSVIAYLQTLGGQPDVTMATKTAYTGGSVGGGAGEGEADGGEGAEGETASAEVGGAYDALGCGDCHYADRPGKLKAASLYDIGARLSSDQIFLGLSGHEREERLDGATLSELQSLVQTLTEMKGTEG